MKNASSEQVSSALIALLERKFKKDLTSLIIFGSRVKGDYKNKSDYDFLVVCKNLPSNPIAANNIIVDIVSDILFETGYRVSPLLFSEEQLLEEVKSGSPLLSSVLTGYRIEYDRGSFMAKALEALKDKAATTYKEKGRSWALRRTV